MKKNELKDLFLLLSDDDRESLVSCMDESVKNRLFSTIKNIDLPDDVLALKKDISEINGNLVHLQVSDHVLSILDGVIQEVIE